MFLENAAHVATAVGVIASLIFFSIERQRARRAADFESFTRLLEGYHKIVQKRRNEWKLVKTTVSKNPKTSHEIHDKQNSLDYLELRARQDEPLYAIEHGLIEREIRSLNYLNELCRIAIKDDRCLMLLAAGESDEISYYQHHRHQLQSLYERESQQRRFSKPRFEYVECVDVSDWFDHDAVTGPPPNAPMPTDGVSTT